MLCDSNMSCSSLYLSKMCWWSCCRNLSQVSRHGKESFSSVKTWLQEIDWYASTNVCKRLLAVGNKCDLADKNLLMSRQQRQVFSLSFSLPLFLFLPLPPSPAPSPFLPLSLSPSLPPSLPPSLHPSLTYNIHCSIHLGVLLFVYRSFLISYTNTLFGTSAKNATNIEEIKKAQGTDMSNTLRRR